MFEKNAWKIAGKHSKIIEKSREHIRNSLQQIENNKKINGKSLERTLENSRKTFEKHRKMMTDQVIKYENGEEVFSKFTHPINL